MRLSFAIGLALLLATGLAFGQEITPDGPSVIVVGTAGQSATTSSATETNLAVLRIPGGAMGPNGVADLKCLWIATGTAAKSVVVRHSATAGVNTGTLVANSQTVTTSLDMSTEHILRNDNAVNVQTIFQAAPSGPYALGTTTPTVGAIDTSVDSFLNLNGSTTSGLETVLMKHCYAIISRIP